MIFYALAPFVILAVAALVADTIADEDGDLVWLDRQIERVTHITPINEDAAYERRETLARLHRERERVLRLHGGIE